MKNSPIGIELYEHYIQLVVIIYEHILILKYAFRVVTKLNLLVIIVFIQNVVNKCISMYK